MIKKSAINSLYNKLKCKHRNKCGYYTQSKPPENREQETEFITDEETQNRLNDFQKAYRAWKSGKPLKVNYPKFKEVIKEVIVKAIDEEKELKYHRKIIALRGYLLEVLPEYINYMKLGGEVKTRELCNRQIKAIQQLTSIKEEVQNEKYI